MTGIVRGVMRRQWGKTHPVEDRQAQKGGGEGRPKVRVLVRILAPVCFCCGGSHVAFLRGYAKRMAVPVDGGKRRKQEIQAAEDPRPRVPTPLPPRFKVLETTSGRSPGLRTRNTLSRAPSHAKSTVAVCPACSPTVAGAASDWLVSEPISRLIPADGRRQGHQRSKEIRTPRNRKRQGHRKTERARESRHLGGMGRSTKRARALQRSVLLAGLQHDHRPARGTLGVQTGLDEVDGSVVADLELG